jgi:hypothetical protein
MGMRLEIDSTRPPSSARMVSRPSSRAIFAGSENLTITLPCASVVKSLRATSLSSTVTTAVTLRLAKGSPVPRATATAAVTSSPGL